MADLMRPTLSRDRYGSKWIRTKTNRCDVIGFNIPTGERLALGFDMARKQERPRGCAGVAV
jgi:hypothetical protein